MKTSAIPAAAGSKTAAFSAALLLALLQGCATPQAATYAAAADAQKRVEAENAAQPAPDINNLATYLKVVGQLQQNEMWFASLAHIDALEQRWGVSPESNRLRADGLRNAGQPVESATYYQRLKGTPLESSGLHGLGLLAGSRGDFPLAVQLLEQARQLKPADPVLLGDLGYAHLRSGRINEARVPLMQAFQLKPDSKQAQVNLALYFEASGDLARAAGLMDSQRMSGAARAAIRNAARELNSALPQLQPGVAMAAAAPAASGAFAVPAAVAAPAPSASRAVPPAEADAPLALTLKTSPWAELSRVQRPRADQPAPVLSAASAAPAR